MTIQADLSNRRNKDIRPALMTGTTLSRGIRAVHTATGLRFGLPWLAFYRLGLLRLWNTVKKKAENLVVGVGLTSAKE